MRFSRKEGRYEYQQSSKIVNIVLGIGIVEFCMANGSKRCLSYRSKPSTALK